MQTRADEPVGPRRNFPARPPVSAAKRPTTPSDWRPAGSGPAPDETPAASRPPSRQVILPFVLPQHWATPSSMFWGTCKHVLLSLKPHAWVTTPQQLRRWVTPSSTAGGMGRIECPWPLSVLEQLSTWQTTHHHEFALLRSSLLLGTLEPCTHSSLRREC